MQPTTSVFSETLSSFATITENGKILRCHESFFIIHLYQMIFKCQSWLKIAYFDLQIIQYPNQMESL